MDAVKLWFHTVGVLLWSESFCSIIINCGKSRTTTIRNEKE